MTALIAGSAAVAVTTLATVVIATFPEAKDVLIPITEGNEYAVATVSMLASLPFLTVLGVLTAAGRE